MMWIIRVYDCTSSGAPPKRGLQTPKVSSPFACSLQEGKHKTDVKL